MAVEVDKFGNTMITGEHIPIFRLLTLKSGLKLEIKGMKMSRGKSCYSIVKQELGFKGSKDQVLSQLEAHIEALKPKVNVMR